MIRIRKANLDESGQIAAFYHANEYRSPSTSPDVIIVAEDELDLDVILMRKPGIE